MHDTKDRTAQLDFGKERLCGFVMALFVAEDTSLAVPDWLLG